jgi:hypothetical protein
MSQSLSNLSKTALRAYRRRNRTCRVNGCHKTVRGLANLCAAHYQRQICYGSPTGRAVAYSQRKPYLQAVDSFMRRNCEHPALVMSLADLEKMLADAAVYQQPRKLKTMDWKSRLARELKRLHEGDIKGADVFRAVSSVYLLAHNEPHALEMYSRAFKFAVSRAVFHMRDRGTRKGRGRQFSMRIASLVLEHFGEMVVIKLLPVLQAMAQTMDRSGVQQRERRDEIVAVLEQEPFNEYATLVKAKEQRDQKTPTPR